MVGTPCFEDVWREHKSKVLAMCRKATHDEDRAQEITQKTAIRAWRNWQSFRGDGPVVAWLFSIARNEVKREWARFIRERRRTADLEEGEGHANTSGGDAEQPDRPAAGPSLESLIRSAGGYGALTANEASVLHARMTRPASTWEQVGASLGLTAVHSAVLFTRAIPKFRVFLLAEHAHMFGGPAALYSAWRAASPKLSPGESKDFQHSILQRSRSGAALIRRAALRAACEKIFRYLPRPEIAGLQGDHT